MAQSTLIFPACSKLILYAPLIVSQNREWVKVGDIMTPRSPLNLPAFVLFSHPLSMAACDNLQPRAAQEKLYTADAATAALADTRQLIARLSKTFAVMSWCRQRADVRHEWWRVIEDHDEKRGCW